MAFLTSVMQDNLVPQGLHACITPQILDTTPETTAAWEKTLTDTSKRLMKITYTQYTQLLGTLNTKIQELEELLQCIQLIDEHANTLTTDQEQRITQLQKKLEHIFFSSTESHYTQLLELAQMN